jgi:FAD-linked sulfhydryl oxidase
MSKEWGNAYWDLIHCLSFKLKTDDKANEIYKLMFGLCTILPCPICTTHSKNYFTKINPNSINTKTKLIDLFYDFHNNVNKRLNKKIFNKDDYNKKYSEKNLIHVLNRFHAIFIKYKKSRRLNIDTMSKQIFLKNFTNFIKSNINQFIIN